MSKRKRKRSKKDNYLTSLLFYVIEVLFLVFVGCFNKYIITRSHTIGDYFEGTSLLFSLTLIPIIIIILYLQKDKLRKIIVTIINVFLMIFSVINYFMYSYFKNIFSWKDVFLSGDGLSFVNSVFKFINFKLILFIFIFLLFIIILIKIKTNDYYKVKSWQTPVLVLLIVVALFGHRNIRMNLEEAVDGWNADAVLSSDNYFYINWIEPVRLIQISGTYEYLIRDFYYSFIKKEDKAKAYKEVKKYIENNDNKKEDIEYNGIFAGENLIYVMMESMDNWLVNEEVTPTIYEMMHHGFNFNNYYSPGYVTGDTANTEFITNTGIYPYINKLSPNYAYVNNNYSYSIANLFKKEGYVVNSFHRSNGSIYNRGNMHLSLGYEKYYNYEDMGIDAKYLDLDTYIAKDGYDKIVSGDKFMSFIITYSPHSPYVYNKIECENNLDEIKKIYPEETNEEYLCAYSSARETDNMFKILLEKLESDNLLDNTIIVAFTDHPNHIKLIYDETDLLNETIFFIYNSTMDDNQIDTIASSINVLPTMINLFGIDTGYVYPGYDALNTSDEYVIFKDYTYYDGNEIKPITDKKFKELKYSFNLLVSDYYK